MRPDVSFPLPAARISIMRAFFFVLVTLAVATSLEAAPASPPVRAEIDALLARLQSSECAFYRNGSWHSAAEAKAHLLRKLKALESRNAVQSTEQFIELGASTSSVSGKPYLVRCGNSAAVESRRWLYTELTEIRSSDGAAAPKAK